MEASVSQQSHPALDPAAVVDEFLRLVMIPDPQSASRFTAPDIRIRFTGNRPMQAPGDTSAFNAKRYAWVKKKIERTETVAGPALPAAASAHRARASGACARPGRHLVHHAGRDRLARGTDCEGTAGGVRLRRSARPQISIFEPSSTTALFGSPRNAAAPLALWCICANSFSRHGAMPLPSVGITTSRDRK